jgi:FkbH-like protein
MSVDHRVVSFLGDKTLDLLVRQVQRQLAEEGSAWRVADGGFDSWMRETMDPQSQTRRGGAVALAYFLSPRALEQVPDIEGRVAEVLETLGRMQAAPTVLFSNMVPDSDGVLPLVRGPELLSLAGRINQRLESFRETHSWFHIVDFAGLATRIGLANLTDVRFEAVAQTYLAPKGVPPVARLWSRCLRALERPASKVCIVDLDNTLWRGVIGEDGAEGLEMGDSGPGLAYRRLQSALLELKRNGILLAVCSKNNPEEALTLLKTHPDCLLRPDDFAALEISWKPKSEGIRSIARRLNLGLDAMVFIDDSAFEREEVRNALPEVRVLEFPADPMNLVSMLGEDRAFDSLRVTNEDRQRAQSYIVEARREALRGESESPEQFFRSLGLKVTVFRATDGQVERLHQLILKTNQFNLTAERLGSDEFRMLASDPSHIIVGLRVADRFGDSGITGLGIVNIADPSVWAISNFLLSCRVIGRTVEHAFVSWLAAMAAEAGAMRIVFRHRDTGRNQVARQFLERSGLIANEAGTEWSLPVADREALAPHYVSLDYTG